MRTCPNCGGDNPGDAAFCGLCGAAIVVPPSPTVLTAPTLEWITSFPLATNRFILYDMAKVILWTGVLLAAIGIPIALAQGAADEPLSDWLQVFAIFGLVLAGLALLLLAVMIVFFRNRFRAWFAVGPRGLAFETRSRNARWSSRAAMAAGMLAGSPGAIGAGLIAYSQEEAATPWSDVRRVRFHPRHCVISVMNGWRVLLRLYCTPANYHEACRLVRLNAPPSAVQGGDA